MFNKILANVMFLLALCPHVLSQSKIIYVKPGTIKTDDRSLDDWNEIQPAEILTLDNQWKNIRGREPASFTIPQDDDLSAKVFLAWDGEYLYCAIIVVDDSVVFDLEQPWSGDSGELFFVGDNLTFDDDFHNIIEQRKIGYGSAFQIIMNGMNANKRKCLSEWRTYKNIILAMQKSEFSVTGLKTLNGWSAETKIPLKSLTNVLKIANAGGIVKIGIDILDYDHRPAPNDSLHDWGYYPENVISTASSEKELVRPITMKEFIFNKQ